MNPVPAAAHGSVLLIYTALAVLLLVVLIARFKVNSVVSLVLASLFIGLMARMDLALLLRSFREGVGNVLGSIALIIAFGNMLGKMLAESGGAERIANTLVARFGEARVHWAMMGIACIVGVPVFFQVGVVLLIPLLFLLSKQTRTPVLFIGVPLLAGLSVMHGLVPPHPGPMAAIGLLKADVGRTIFYSLIVGLPTVVIAGPLLAPIIVRRVPFEPRGAVAAQFTEQASRRDLPGFGVTVFTVILPVLLMLLATGVDIVMPATSGARRVIDFLGDPIPAMLIAVLVSFYTLGFARGFTRAEVLRFSDECLAPIAGVLLIIGSGGGFSRVLSTSGVGDAVAAIATGSQVPPLLLGWLIAALIRLATGSATVAITTAAGILAPMVSSTPGLNIELMVLAMGAGSLIFSHLNDSGFWFVKEYFGMSVGETLRTWSVIETVISIVAIVLILALNQVV
jgi:GntP family gluconate:H+ symporter